MEEKYLIWLDILGFKNLTKEIAKKTRLTERKVRSDFIQVINERVETIQAKGEIIGKNYGERDDWVLVTNSLDLVFKVVMEILDHCTEYKDYEKIPLEIAIGIGEYDKRARFKGTRLIIEKSTVDFLKTKIVGYYHNWYRRKYNNKSPTSTFIVITKSAYNQLEPLDKKMCQKTKFRHERNDGTKEATTFFIADVDRVQQRGKVLEFLEKVKRPRSKLYDRIVDVYVPPLEYEEIKEALEKDRIVFITGTPEYGKTYTAVRLLWEYFDRGYEPIWIKGGEEEERRHVRERLEEIERELKRHHIIFFEDPFGKTRYESRENLEREIGTIIACVRHVEDVYVIITSREEAFKEFQKEHLSTVKLKKFEKKLNIKKPSYNYKKRKEILLKWMESKCCKWAEDNDLRDHILSLIKDEEILPTPLSIKDFVTSTIAITEEHKLIEKIREKSEETARSFADEITNMSDDKILFLSFPFISPFPVNFVSIEYAKLAGQLRTNKPWGFEKVLNWFKDDKVAIVNRRIRFSHPSYHEALQYLLVEKGRPTRINKDILCKVLLKLSRENKAVRAVAKILRDNFDDLPRDVKNELLSELSKKNKVAYDVITILGVNFQKLSTKLRNELLFKLSKIDKIAGHVAWVITMNFDKLPTKLRSLLSKLSEKDDATEDVAWAIDYNFDMLPEQARNELLSELSKKDKAAEHVAWTIVDNFDKLPEELRSLLFELLEREAVAEDVKWIIKDNFAKLPKRVRKTLKRKFRE